MTPCANEVTKVEVLHTGANPTETNPEPPVSSTSHSWDMEADPQA